MKYKAVLFDLDDTLIKTWEAKWAQHKFVAKKYYGVELTDAVLGTHWGKGFDVMLGHLYGHPEPADKMRKNYLRHEDEFPKQVHDEAVAMVTALLDAGVAVGLVTSMTTEIARKDLVEQGFPWERFAIVQGSDLSLVHKPDPEVFAAALNRLRELGITDGIMYVGDALNDFYAAQGAGLDFTAVTTGFADEFAFKQAGAKRILGRVADLAPLVLGKPIL